MAGLMEGSYPPFNDTYLCRPLKICWTVHTGFNNHLELSVKILLQVHLQKPCYQFLLPLNDQVWPTPWHPPLSCQSSGTSQKASLNHSIGITFFDKFLFGCSSKPPVYKRTNRLVVDEQLFPWRVPQRRQSQKVSFTLNSYSSCTLEQLYKTCCKSSSGAFLPECIACSYSTYLKKVKN